MGKSVLLKTTNGRLDFIAMALTNKSFAAVFNGLLLRLIDRCCWYLSADSGATNHRATDQQENKSIGWLILKSHQFRTVSHFNLMAN